jgi:hypothetical protein
MKEQIIVLGEPRAKGDGVINLWQCIVLHPFEFHVTIGTQKRILCIFNSVNVEHKGKRRWLHCSRKIGVKLLGSTWWHSRLSNFQFLAVFTLSFVFVFASTFVCVCVCVYVCACACLFFGTALLSEQAGTDRLVIGLLESDSWCPTSFMHFAKFYIVLPCVCLVFAFAFAIFF